MSEELNRKLTSMLEQAGIKIEGSDISVLNKKSYKLILSTKKNLKKSGVTIDTFIDLNTVWKMNILLSRFVFKYSNFAENYLLALIENSLVINKTTFLEAINKAIAKSNSRVHETDSEKTIKKRENKIKTLKKCVENISNLKKLKFAEKCTIYTCLYQASHSSILIIEPDIFSKIRTLRNKAVHSDYIIEYFQSNTHYSNSQDLYSLVDPDYQENFKKELDEIINKYELKFSFEQITFK